jgi:hypothetical protein
MTLTKLQVLLFLGAVLVLALWAPRPAVYRNARPFHGGFAVVRRDDHWFLIDRAGRNFLSVEDAAPLAATR